MGERFWIGVLGTVVGGVVTLWIGAKYFAQGGGVLQAGNTGGGGPQAAGAKPVAPVAVYPDTQSQPSWAIPDPSSDLYNSQYGATANQAGRAGTQDYFGVPLGRRIDSGTYGIPAKMVNSTASRRT